MLGSSHRSVALGFGSGLSPIAPGTAGTLLAWALYGVMQFLFSDTTILIMIGLGLLYGCWACGICSQDLGRPDHSAIVWDEIIAFWLILWSLGSASFALQAIAFGLFRFFDAIKPWPISIVDQYFKKNSQIRSNKAIVWHGFGIMVDDLVAALFTIAIVLIGVRLF